MHSTVYRQLVFPFALRGLLYLSLNMQRELLWAAAGPLDPGTMAYQLGLILKALYRSSALSTKLSTAAQPQPKPLLKPLLAKDSTVASSKALHETG
jgi:hypothetical protein